MFACVCDTPGVCNIGAICASGLPGPDCPDLGMNATCESRMWHAPNDNTCIPSHHAGLDPVANCTTMPETFSPTCALTFRLLSRGTARFHNVFGWYEANAATPTAPTAAGMHVMLDCTTIAGSTTVLDVRSDPAYHGGPVGFFLLTPEDHAAHGSCAGGDCCASVARFQSGVGYAYFSEHTLNPDGNGVVHLLEYDSRIHARRFYFAWEDLFGVSDNEFTDLVTSVDGVECAGAGVTCDTHMPGACGRGVTSCAGGTLTCTAVTTPVMERCNGLDDDCDAMIDEAATCSGTNVCDDGRCVPHCLPTDELTCALGFTCDASGLCRETACRGVTCGATQVCRAGACVAECDGIVCPHGQVCARDQCVDPCAGTTCAAMQVCRGGLCVAGCNLCNGVACAGGLMCLSAGAECVDPTCATGCAAGTFCRAGVCVDACEGAICPRHETCALGQCVVPAVPDAGAFVMDGGVRRDASMGFDTNLAGFDAGDGIVMRRACACDAPGSTRTGWIPITGVLALALITRRRIRRSRAAAMQSRQARAVSRVR